VECLDEDTVLAFVDGHLDAPKRSDVESHLAACPSCSDLVAAAAGADPERLAGADEPAADRTLPPGASVGRYVILASVGRGGMGEVYAAYDPQLDRKIALKLLHDTAPRAGAVRTGRERLLREAKAIARLHHPNVVVVHDAGSIDDPVRGERVFLAMEFVEGETLAAWLASAPRTWRQIRDVFVAAGEGLAAAHDAGLVHRDFKPQNVMVGRDGLCRVMDFGLCSDAADVAAGEQENEATSEATDEATGEEHGETIDLAGLPGPPRPETLALTRTGVLLGTPLYMAPEQFLARRTDARTDQFSFCVALHEALYGERPFPSDSLSALIDAVVAGRVQEPAQKARTPAFIRKLLLRGLRADPADRHPSMRELLATLRLDPARRQRTLALAVVAGALVLAAGFGIQQMASRGQLLCRGGGDRLTGAWQLDARGARRAAVHRAFVGTGRPFAEDTWRRVSGLLDDYGRRWVGMYTDACEATHVRGDQSPEVLDLRMTCLEGRRGALRALGEVLTHADPAALVEAVNAAQSLPALDRCADVEALRAVVPPPADAATRARVAEVRSGLAEVKALGDIGRLQEGARKADPLVGAARATGYAPLLAEALSARAWLEEKVGGSKTSAATYEQALWAALAGREDEMALEAAAQLVAINGDYLDRQSEADRWMRLGESLLARLGPGHERTKAWFYQGRSVTRQRRGDYQGALADLQLALALKQKVLPADHPDVAMSLVTIASVEIDLGDAAAAFQAADQGLAIMRRAYGADSPVIGMPLGDRGEALELLGRLPEAERDLRASIEMTAAWVGREHPWTAYPGTALGKTLIAEGRAREAIPVLETALRVREKSEPAVNFVAETRFALARARWEAGHDRDGARTLAEAARDGYRTLPSEAKHAAEVDAWLADHAAARRKNSR
jgi:tetratricopeptide (TPR) repeat protein